MGEWPYASPSTNAYVRVRVTRAPILCQFLRGERSRAMLCAWPLSGGDTRSVAFEFSKQVPPEPEDT
jgi:hypothetical protein